jgi:Bacterial regulatory protein, Fis family
VTTAFLLEPKLRKAELEAIQAALDATKNNRIQAARLLGISVRTLQRMIAGTDLEQESCRPKQPMPPPRDPELVAAQREARIDRDLQRGLRRLAKPMTPHQRMNQAIERLCAPVTSTLTGR